MSDYRWVELSVANGVATLRLNRPEKRNAFTDDMRSEFVAALGVVAADRDARALVLTGNGKGFCAGGDIAGMQARMDAPAGEVAFNGWTRQQGVHRAVTALHNMPKPTIAAVNGAAAGLGADTALCCDFVLAADDASFTWSYIARGLIPDGGGMYFLPRRVGLPRAKDLIFSGRRVLAPEALALGIADRTCPADELLAQAQAWAESMAGHSATALALSKSILDQTFELPANQVFALGSQAQGICYTSAEHRASVLAFLDKMAEAKR